MIKKFCLIIPVILFLVLKGLGQETEVAPTSAITDTRLPAGALRILPSSVPAEINSGLDKIVQAGEGKVIESRREVLAWTSPGYKKAGAPNLIAQLQKNLAASGWSFEVSGSEGGITVFGAFKKGPVKRALLGYYVPTEDAMVVAWAEIVSSDKVETNSASTDDTQQSQTQVSSGNLVGRWDNGRVSTVTRQNTVTGMTTPGSSTRFEYGFMADGRFSFTGIAQTVNYGCTDTLFNEKAGRYTLNGSTLTLTPAKNYWKKTNSCSASGNSERNYTLNKEVYEVSFKTDEYGAELVCLNDGKGDACYRRMKK